MNDPNAEEMNQRQYESLVFERRLRLANALMEEAKKIEVDYEELIKRSDNND